MAGIKNDREGVLGSARSIAFRIGDFIKNKAKRMRGLELGNMGTVY